jgi:hypothetical protein
MNMSDLEVTGNLIVDGTVYNKNSYCTLDTDGSTWVNALKIASTSPNTDFHFLPDFSTQSGGTSKVYFGYNSDWGSYNWMNGTNNVMCVTSSGVLTSKNNTLDDGSGNATWVGCHTFNDTGYYLVYHSDNGGYTTIETPSGTLQSPTSGNIHVFCSQVSPYNHSLADKPLLYVDLSIFAENDIATFGSLSTLSDPQKLATGRGGGGALAMGHGWTSPSDMPIIDLADAQSGYDTIWIKAAPSTYQQYAVDWPWGSLELQNLWIHGFIQAHNQPWITALSPINITSYYTANTSGYGYLNSAGSFGYSGNNTGNVNVSLQTSYRIFCGGEIDVYSDQRDKNLIDTLNGQTALNAVVKLNPLHFAWKPETQKGDHVIAGFFAQEVARAIPEAVIVHKGERYTDEHTLNYNVLTTYALSAIQSLKKEIENLQSEIKSQIRSGAI